jgi:hypothetical protein
MIVLDIEVWKQLRNIVTVLASIRQTFLNADSEALAEGPSGNRFDSKIIRRIEALAESLTEDVQLILNAYNSERHNFDKVNSFLHLRITDEEFGEVLNKLERKKTKIDYNNLKDLDITVKYYNYIVEHVDKHLGHIKL